jgi:hypothetical protein
MSFHEEKILWIEKGEEEEEENKTNGDCPKQPMC